MSKQELTAKDIASELGLSEQTIFRMSKIGAFPQNNGTSPSGAWLWSRVRFDRWLTHNPAWTTPMHEFDITALEVCQRLNISMLTLYRWVDAGKLPQPELVRMVDHKGRLHGRLRKVWNCEEVAMSSINSKQNNHAERK